MVVACKTICTESVLACSSSDYLQVGLVGVLVHGLRTNQVKATSVCYNDLHLVANKVDYCVAQTLTTELQN